MMQAYYVELLGRHGEVKSRQRVEHLPISIGRAYANDVILDDAAAAPFHAAVEQAEDGTLCIRELGSQQGIVQYSQGIHQSMHLGKRVASLTLDANSVVKLGHTLVRVRGESFVPGPDSVNKAALQWDGFIPAITGLLLLALTSLISVWLSGTGKFSTATYLFGVATLFGLVLLWSGCWAFAGRVISGQARFGRHVFIVACALVLIDLWAVISMVIAYAFSLAFIAAYGNHAIMAIVATMIFYHLMTISEQHRKGFVMACTTVMAIGSGMILLTNYQRSGSLADTQFMSHLLPPVVRQTENQPADQFIQEARELKEELDKARLEAVDNSEI